MHGRRAWSGFDPLARNPLELAPGAEGIDVSRWQGTIDWPSVKAAGKVFAFIRASMGATGIDERFTANWQGGRAAGLLVGAYHYLPKEALGAAQADQFIAQLRQQGAGYGDLPPVVDVEPRSGEILTVNQKSQFEATLGTW